MWRLTFIAVDMHSTLSELTHLTQRSIRKGTEEADGGSSSFDIFKLVPNTRTTAHRNKSTQGYWVQHTSCVADLTMSMHMC